MKMGETGLRVWIFLYILTTGIVNSSIILQVFTQSDPNCSSSGYTPLKPVEALSSQLGPTLAR